MALYALEDVDDAYEVTRDFLLPFDRTRWAKLALVVLFVAGAGAPFPQFGFGGDGGGDPGTAPPGDAPPFDPGAEFWVVAGLVALVAVALVVLFGVISSVMEFVLVESLRSGDVTIRRYWSRRWRQGVRLFAFRLAVGLVLFAVTLLLIGVVAAPALLGVDAAGVSVLVLFLLVPVVVVVAVLGGLIDGFTREFVVPVMVLEDRRVLDGWRRLWPTITAHWTQYLGYAVAAFVLGIAGSVLSAIVVGVLAVVLLVPFGILFAVGVALLTFVGPLGIAVLGVTAVLYALAVIAVAALVQVPVQAYLRYYALLVLGDVEPTLDLIPERRAAVREPDATGAGAP